MKSTTKLLLLLATLSMVWVNYCQADLILLDSASTPEDKKQGYVENTEVYFAVTNGQSLAATDAANRNPFGRSMRRVELDIEGKKIVIQNSSDKELYVKGQDKNGNIISLEKNDYATLQLALTNLAIPRNGDTESELHDAVGTALSLLASWPQDKPLLIWQDDKQRITAVNSDTVISQPLNPKESSRTNPAKPIDKTILQRPDDLLKLPKIEPLQALPLLDSTGNDKEAAAPVNISQKAANTSSDSSISLCKKMGKAVSGNYPLISTTFSFPFTTVDGREKYAATVGGSQCLGRCGGGCVDSVSGVYGLGKNAYSKDCLDHDMCASKRGNFGYCDFIFNDAANDFFSTPCGHDLILENIVVSNDSTATSQESRLSSKLKLYILFTVKNKGNTRLPHKRVYFDLLVDGERLKTVQLTRVLNANNSIRYFYPLGKVSKIKPGTHTVNILMKSTSIIQTDTANDVINPKTFTVF